MTTARRSRRRRRMKMEKEKQMKKKRRKKEKRKSRMRMKEAALRKEMATQFHEYCPTCHQDWRSFRKTL